MQESETNHSIQNSETAKYIQFYFPSIFFIKLMHTQRKIPEVIQVILYLD